MWIEQRIAVCRSLGTAQLLACLCYYIYLSSVGKGMRMSVEGGGRRYRWEAKYIYICRWNRYKDLYIYTDMYMCEI